MFFTLGRHWRLRRYLRLITRLEKQTVGLAGVYVCVWGGGGWVDVCVCVCVCVCVVEKGVVPIHRVWGRSVGDGGVGLGWNW